MKAAYAAPNQHGASKESFSFFANILQSVLTKNFLDEILSSYPLSNFMNKNRKGHSRLPVGCVLLLRSPMW